MLLSICIFILLLVLLLVIDFHFGERAFQKNPPVFPFQPTNSTYNLFASGDDFFSSLFQSMKEATNKIEVMFFIVRNDEISKEMYNILKERAEAGVTVRLLVDRMGSFSLNKTIIQDLKNSGVQFAYSNRPSFPYFFYKLNRRNHRKITIIDETYGFVGGFNVGKEYIGKDPKLGPWRDYHLKVKGPIIPQLKKIFNYDWDSALAGKRVAHPYTKDITKNQTNQEQKRVQLIVSESGQLEDKMTSWIHSAKSEILIGTPYFIPSKSMFDALLSALARGVEVNLIVPMKADHPLVKPAAFPFLKTLHHAGGNIHLYDNGFYHAKVLIIDESFCDVGSANFDMRSVFLNKELNTVIDSDPDFIKDIRSAYFEDIKKSISFTENWIKQQPVHTKLAGIVARCIRPLL